MATIIIPQDIASGSSYTGNPASNSIMEGAYNILSGATASDNTIQAGGEIIIQSGGTGENITVESGGNLNLLDGANISGASITSGASLYVGDRVYAGPEAYQSLDGASSKLTNLTVTSGGSADISSSHLAGTATITDSATITGGVVDGSINITNGASATNLTINDNEGSSIIINGGTLDNITISGSSPGSMAVPQAVTDVDESTIANVTMSDAVLRIVDETNISNLTMSASLINSMDEGTISTATLSAGSEINGDGVTLNNVDIQSGASINDDEAHLSNVQVESGANLTLDSYAQGSGLRLIEGATITVDDNTTVTMDPMGRTLTISGDGQTSTIEMTGVYVSQTLASGTDANGDNVYTLSPENLVTDENGSSLTVFTEDTTDPSLMSDVQAFAPMGVGITQDTAVSADSTDSVFIVGDKTTGATPSVNLDLSKSQSYNYVMGQSTNGDNITMGAQGGDIQLGDSNNTITGSTVSGSDLMITVGNGNNTITTNAGNDTIITGNGSNKISLGSGQNTVISDGKDTITGATGSQYVELHGSDQTVNLTGTNNTIAASDDSSEKITVGANASIDALNSATATTGANSTIGSATDSTIHTLNNATIDNIDNSQITTLGNATVDGLSGNNTVSATKASVTFEDGDDSSLQISAVTGTIFSGMGNQTATQTGAGRLTFVGSAENTMDTNTVFNASGGTGANIFEAYGSMDMRGGTGAGNTFEIFKNASGAHDTIEDFSAAGGNKIELSGFDLTKTQFAAIYDDATKNAGQNPTSLTLNLDNNTQLTINDPGHLSQSSFSLAS